MIGKEVKVRPRKNLLDLDRLKIKSPPKSRKSVPDRKIDLYLEKQTLKSAFTKIKSVTTIERKCA